MAIKKISEFVSAVPSSDSKILFEQNGKGKSCSVGDVVDACSLSYEEIMAASDLTNKVASASALKEVATLDLLWTNASPSSFSPQTINLNLSGYKMVLIDIIIATAEFNTANWARECILLTFGSDANLYRGLYGDFAAYRKIIVGTTSIQFGEGVEASLSGVSVNNNVLVPYKIYGVK